MEMNSVIKRLFSAVLCAVMVLGCFAGVTMPVKADQEAISDAAETVTAESAVPEVTEQEVTEPAVVPDREPAAPVRKPAVKSAASLTKDTYTSADGKWSFAPYGEGVQITAYHGTATDVYVPFKVTYNEEDYAVLKLADSLFADNDSLNSVTLGEGITEIGAKTFYDCDNLVCIVTNETLTTIGAEAFYSCDSFNSVILYDAVSTIGENAFAECPELTIWCNEATAAHTYATANSIPYEILNPNATPETYIQDGITYYIMNGEAIAIDFDESTTEVEIPVEIEGYPVTGLYAAFQNCSQLTSVTLPNTIQNIGSKTFYCCKKLQTVNIPAGVQQIGSSAFEECSVLTAIDLPDGLQTIEYACFADCDGLTEIEMPETVTSIAGEAFYSCNKLQSVVIPDSVTSIGKSAFYNSSLKTLTIGGGVKEMGNYAFASCYGLREVIICDGSEVIGGRAFYDCYSLTNVVIPDTVKTIGTNAFGMSSSAYRNEIKTLDIGKGVQTIEANAFSACTQVQTIVIPESLQQMYINSFPASTILCVYENSYAHTFTVNNDLMYFIYDGTNLPLVYVVDGISYYITGGSAVAYTFDQSLTSVVIPDQIDSYPVTELRGTFQNCSNLISVTLPNTIQNIGSKTFYCCKKLQTVNIPAGVQQIGSSAFEECSVLTAIDLPDGLQTIEYACFADCDGLTEIEMPETVTSIAGEAFYSCNKLQSVVIPDSVTSIGKSAFYNSSLKTLTIGGGVKEMGNYAFASCYGLREVIICDGSEVIGGRAFYDCYSLTNVVIPDTVKTIGTNAFGMSSSAYRNEIKTLDIGKGVQTIEANAFSACTQVQTIVLPESLQQMYINSFPASTILCVYENSYAHTFVQENNLLYFVMRKTENPEISFGAGISGNVSYLDGSAATNATVEIFYDDGVLKEAVTTDETGAYEFTYAEVGAYTIRVTDAGGNTATTQVSVKRMNAFDVFLSGDPDLKLKKGYSVSGTVSIYPATVTITDEEGNVLGSVETADGSFTFENVPNGTYIITATTESGSVSQEITVFDGNVSDIVLTVTATAATLWGYVEVEDRELNHHRRNWVEVTVYNAEGLAIAQTKTDKDGKYTFTGLPAGEYAIVAQTAEMRPDHKHGFDRSHTLTGYAYITVTEAATYQVDTIILREENDHKATISGKVTAHGETQNCQVVLHNVFRSEIASMTTGKNGKYSFKNISDGLYFVTATTESDGMGYAVVVVHNGKVYGETDITVYKSDKVKDREEKFYNDVPHCGNREDALKHRDRIAEEKRFYDGLSEKEKKQLSKDYVNRLDQLVQWITDCTVETGDGVTMEQGGLVISGQEAAKAENITFTLNVTPSEAHNASTDGVHNREDQIHHNIHDKSNKHDVLQYYDITLSKEVDGVSTQITSVTKDTEANGKLRITLQIPEEYRGYKHYTVVHEHCGDVVTLTDLDNDPDTVTFEVKKFSTFVLTGTNISLTEIEDETSSIVESWGLTLTDNICVNFTMSADALADENACVEVTAAGKVTQYSAADAAKGIAVTLAAAQMNETITLCIVDGNGNRGESSSYTVRQYCDVILADADYSSYHQLVKQMLRYGGAAQSYFNYDAENPADAGITGVAAEEIPANAEGMTVSGAVSGISYRGASLLFRDKIAVRFYFTGDVTGCSFQINGTPCEITEDYIEVEGILPQNLDQQITLTVTDAHGSTLTVCYGAMDYIVRMSEKGSTELQNLLKALYNYHLAAKAFAEQQP